MLASVLAGYHLGGSLAIALREITSHCELLLRGNRGQNVIEIHQAWRAPTG
jgi:hypothetical protein